MTLTLLEDFGTEKRPIHVSEIPQLLRCNAATVLRDLLTSEGAKPAADTGSAMHKASAAWHTNGRLVEEALAVMRDRLADYPAADLDDAEQLFRAYAGDTVNITADVVAVEMPVAIVFETTGQPIHIVGTCDQIRRVGSRLLVWDIKCSKRAAYTVVHDYAPQLAAYTLAAANTLKQRVEPGGFILPRNYGKVPRKKDTPPPPVHVEAPYGHDDCMPLLAGLAPIVASIRAGKPWTGPGDYCTYCPVGGIDRCVPKLRELTCLAAS